MQTFLTLLFDLILVSGGSYLGIGFVLGLIELWQKCDPDYQPEITSPPRAALPAASGIPLEMLPMRELKRQEAVEVEAWASESNEES
ncbi:MAG: hypothetical protein VKK04_24410 [Synechococcales bacterium]|nr:hypothetical protein [Synechococcales bacterium]